MDNAIKRVLRRYVNNAGRGGYVFDALTSLGDGAAGSYAIPSVADRTSVNGRARNAPSVISSTQNLLAIDQHLLKADAIPDNDLQRLLEGNYLEAIADRRFNELRNETDNDIVSEHLGACAAVGGSNAAYADGGNVVNADPDELTLKMLADVESDLVGDGFLRANFAYVASPLAFGRVRALSDLAPQMQQFVGTLGTPFAGVSVNGIPMLETPGLPSRMSYAISASERVAASDTLEVTVPKRTGIQVGMQVWTVGLTTDTGTEASPAEVTDVTSGTSTDVIEIDAGTVGSNVADNGTGTLFVEGAPLLLVDRTQSFVAGSPAPQAKVVEDTDMKGQILQHGMDYGRYVQPGAVRLLMVA